MKLWKHTTFRYFCYGALFGALFPLTATIFDIWLRGLPLSGDSIQLVQATQPLHWMIDTAPLFLGIFAAIAGWRQQQVERLYTSLVEQHQRLERAEEVARLNTENAQLYQETRRQLDELQLLHHNLERASATIRALSLPLLPVQHDVSVLPLIGVFDAARLAELRSAVIIRIARQRPGVVIVDCTGIVDVEPDAAYVLIEMITALALLGTNAIVTGVTPALAGRLMLARIDQNSLTTAPDLASGIRQARTTRIVRR